MKLSRIIPAFLLSICLIAGVLMLFFGIKGKIELDRRIQGYAVTEGYLIDTEVYIEHSTSTRRHRSDTYQLTYIYEVEGQEYTVKTDYGTGSVPALGSAKEIYYNPKNPQEAVISGTNSRTVMIFGGIMFTGIPLVFIMVFLQAMGILGKTRINVMDLVVGGVIGSIGAGMLYLIVGSFSVKAALQTMSFFAFIPYMFMIVAVWMFIRGLFLGGMKHE